MESLELPAQASIASLAGYRNGVVALAREPVNGSAAVTVRVSDSRLGAAQVVSLPVDPSVELDLVTLADGGLFVSWLDDRVRGCGVSSSNVVLGCRVGVGSGVHGERVPARLGGRRRRRCRTVVSLWSGPRVTSAGWVTRPARAGGCSTRSTSGRVLVAVARRRGAASGGRCFAVGGGAVPGAVAAANLTPVGASAPGNGQLLSSDVVSPPVASNVNFGQGTVDPNVGFAAGRRRREAVLPEQRARRGRCGGGSSRLVPGGGVPGRADGSGATGRHARRAGWCTDRRRRSGGASPCRQRRVRRRW